MLQILYNRISSDFPEFSYILTLTHTINKYWSVYIETQDFSSDLYKDQIFRTGAAYLFNDDLQFEATFGTNTKNSSIFFLNLGASYRLDFHKDVDPEVKLEEKLMKKEERMYKKGAKKAQKADKEIKKLERNQMVEIIEVRTKSELKAFVNFQFTLYKRNPFWVPPIKKKNYTS